MKPEQSRALALIRCSHPLPCLAVASFAAVFAYASSLNLLASLVIFAAVLLQQISVGWSNDWLDYKRDKAANRTDKPTVNGLVPVAVIRAGSVIAAALAEIVALLLGSPAAAVMLFMLMVGWSYNLGLKANWASVIPYALGFGVLPIFVGLALPEPFWAPTWVVCVAALLGVAAHFANTLPDIAADKLTGVNALPHLIGQRASAVVIAATAMLATMITVTSSAHLASGLGLAGLVVALALAGTASVLSLRPKPPRVMFLLLVLASLTNVILLVLGTRGF